ncbi:MAG TPA: hypothetical protein VF933_37475 [Streptosporangiaceae bacterium]
MSFTDRLLLWFHIGFVIFAIGPVTIATMSTPRYIRARNVGVLRYLSRMTRIFGAASLGVLVFGIIAGQSLHEMSKTWVTTSMTLFVVALVLLVLIMRDQHKAIVAVEASLAAAPGAPAVAASAPGGGSAAAGEAGAPATAPGGAGDATVPAGAEPTAADVEPAPAEAEPPPAATTSAAPAHVATVERGRIASLAGVVSLIWLVILVLMVWNS